MSYRLTINPALEEGNNTASFTYPNKDELDRAENNMADLLLFMQDDVGCMPDYSNMFIREQFRNGEWEEIED